MLAAAADAFSPLLELPVPFSISQRLPNVGLPRAARVPCSKSRRRLNSGKEKDERLRRMLPGGGEDGAFLLISANDDDESREFKFSSSIWL